MLDLKNMPDEEFSILVIPSAPQTVMYVRVEEAGSVLLSSKMAEILAKAPVQLRFNKDCTAIQISTGECENSVTFPKSGRKTVPNAAKILRDHRISFPVFFRGDIYGEAGKWRGAHQPLPTGRPSQITRGTKKNYISFHGNTTRCSRGILTSGESIYWTSQASS